MSDLGIFLASTDAGFNAVKAQRDAALAQLDAECKAHAATSGKLQLAEQDLEMADGCLAMVADVLQKIGCRCGKGDEVHNDTPPMMYDQWICCVVQTQVKKHKDKADAALALLGEVFGAIHSGPGDDYLLDTDTYLDLADRFDALNVTGTDAQQPAAGMDGSSQAAGEDSHE